MEEWIQEFLRGLPTTKAYAENTLAAYRVDLVQFHNFVTLARPTVVTWSRVDKTLLLEYIIYLRERGYSAASVSRKIAALKSFFFYLAERDLIYSDPMETLDTPRVKHGQPRALTPKEVERLLDALPADLSAKSLRDRALIQVLAATGLRVSELVAMDTTDVNWDARVLRCRGARHRERELPVRERAWQALVEYCDQARPKMNGAESENALFLNMTGERLTRQGLWVIVKTYVIAAGIDRAVTPHTLRHSFAIQLLREGQDVAQVQQMLGHSHKTTTQKYAVGKPTDTPRGSLLT